MQALRHLRQSLGGSLLAANRGGPAGVDASGADGGAVAGASGYAAQAMAAFPFLQHFAALVASQQQQQQQHNQQQQLMAAAASAFGFNPAR